MTGAQTSGSDVGKAATAFADGAGQIQGQVDKVTSSKVTAEKAGRKFHDAGQAYRKALEKLGDNIRSYADHGQKLSESFQQSAKEYQASDESGAESMRGVES